MQKISIDAFFPIFLAQQEPGNPFGFLMIMGLMFAAMWFLLIAPQRKKQKELQKMITELKTGDEVLTAGGIYGVISNVKDDRFVLKVGDNTKVEINKSFVQSVIKKDV
jgi:preprotein translocase subunit YajC